MLHRKVKVFKWEPKLDENNRRYNERVKNGIAMFHQWGCDFEEFETGIGNYSTAIVEYENGKVENVPVDLVEFIN